MFGNTCTTGGENEMKILKVATCGGCGESRFQFEISEIGWCPRDHRQISRYTIPDWCPLEDDSIIDAAKELMQHIQRTRLDMGGNHRYHLSHTAHPIITKLKRLIEEEEEKE